jgi:CheY-like chemotaxis protein
MMLCTRTRVLIVDDEPLVQTVMSLVLARGDRPLPFAEYGFSASVESRKELPGICISDLNLPVTNGLDLLSAVRRHFPFVQTVTMGGAFSEGRALHRRQIVCRFSWAVGSEPPKRLKPEQGQ